MANNKKNNTQTHIRTIYSDLSYITIKFFNNSLSFNFVPAIGRDSNGFNQYQKTSNPSQPVGITTTMNYETAATLNKIININIMQAVENNLDTSITISLANKTEMIIERKNDEFGHKKVFLSIKRDNQLIPFKFAQQKVTIIENGNQNQKYIEGGLLNLQSILKGFLEGINADRHLNKLTDDFTKSQEGNSSNNNYKGNNNYKNNRYNNNYSNNNQQQNNNNNDLPWNDNPQQNSISISSYTIEE